MAAQIQTERKLLLDPSNTLIFYEALYFHGSTRRRVERLFEDVSLKKSLPDGLVLEEDQGRIKINEVIEYTLYRPPEKFRNREAAFSADRQRYPNVFDGAGLRFVVAEGFRKPRIKEKLIMEVDFTEIPISYYQYRKFITEVFHEIQGNPALSQQEVIK